MKKYALLTVLFILVIILGNSCSGGGEYSVASISVSGNSFSSDVEGDEKSITVESSDSWTAVSSAKSWLVAEPSSGNAGTTTVKIKIKPYKNDDNHEDRSGSITFTAGEAQTKVSVKQSWSESFSLPCSEYTIGNGGGEITVCGLPKSGFSISVPVDAKSWLRAVSNVLEVDYNPNELGRSATLTIVDSRNSLSYKVFLVQLGTTGNSNVLQLKELILDGYQCPSDSFTEVPDFMYSVDADKPNTSKSMKIEFKGDGVQWVTIGDSDKKVYSGDTFTFDEMSPNTKIKIRTYNKTTSLNGESQLIITSLPLVKITSVSPIKDEPKVDCTIQIFDPKARTDDGDNKNLVMFESKAGIEYRGAGALRYPKKPYNFKLKTDTGEKREAELLNIRNDNSWILDAMYLDMARMRNRVCFDLWNTFNKPYYVDEKPKAMSGTRGDYVEVFVNGEYMGLFILSDRIDRKQYQIEPNGGFIYKAKGWTPACYLQGYNKPSNDDYYWNSAEIEQEYPDADDGQKPNFNHMASFIDFVSKTSKSEFSAKFAERIDENSVIDTFIFLNLILGYDNAGRNTYWIFRNINESNKVMHGLWDLDGVLGRDWNRVVTSATVGWYYGNSPTPGGSNYFKLFRRIIDGDVDGLQQKIYDRWVELKDKQLAPAEFNKLVDHYAEMQISSGARDREVARWRELETQDAATGTNGWIHYSGNYGDVEGEVHYMKQWYRDRHKKLNSLLSTFNGK